MFLQLLRRTPLMALLVASGAALACAAPRGRPAAPAPAPAPGRAPAAPPAAGEHRLERLPDFDRYYGTWLWLRTEGVLGDMNPELKGASRRLVLRPDLTYEFIERRAAKDSTLCRGRYLISEQTGGGGGREDFVDFEGWLEPYERQMFADFDGPDTLHLIGYPCENCPDHTFVRGRAAALGGTVKRGERFSRDLWDGLTFELAPTHEGWEIAIRDSALSEENLARLTPPLHGPNPGRFIEGSQFSGAGKGAPSRDRRDPARPARDPGRLPRDFIFSREVGRTIDGPGAERAVTEEDIERIANAGRGVVTIEDVTLGLPATTGQAEILSMRISIAVEETISRRATPGRPDSKRARP